MALTLQDVDKIIDDAKLELIMRLDFGPFLQAVLRRDDVITESLQDELRVPNLTPHQKINILLDGLKTGPVERFLTFCQTLHTEGQGHLLHVMGVDINQIEAQALAQSIQQYTVEVCETEAAKRCDLRTRTPYELLVLPECVCVAEKNNRLLSLDYRHIRWHSAGKDHYEFEAGRNSPSGEGLFVFLTRHGDQLFNNVQDWMQQTEKIYVKPTVKRHMLGGSESAIVPVSRSLPGDMFTRIMEAMTRSSSQNSERGLLPGKSKVYSKILFLMRRK